MLNLLRDDRFQPLLMAKELLSVRLVLDAPPLRVAAALDKATESWPFWVSTKLRSANPIPRDAILRDLTKRHLTKKHIIKHRCPKKDMIYWYLLISYIFFHLFTPPIFYCTKKTGVFEREKQRGAFAWRAWLAEARTGESDPLSDRDEESKIWWDNDESMI